MADRRLPYARTLALLRVLSWPYWYPPLSWLSRGIEWLSATPVRLAATIAACAYVIVWTIVIKVVIYGG
ncbi:hypothetical protein AB0K35_27855 [Micromonospora sp. NPDC053740]|uniref:hypothetical protein n=1 Tax=Micromonospora sp. NPDC053740 TaxID=3155173 RepID=UPI003421D918